jgi:threonine dehydrogenase-like Zn-dependent dehydrogenase
MRALVLHETLELIENYPEPTPRTGEALIRVQTVGICRTDLELLRGYKGFRGIPGHEFVGIVESAPSDPAWEGRRVVGEINIACGICRMCTAGYPTHCLYRATLGLIEHNGALAESMTLPIRNLHAVPDTVPNEVAVFTEPLAAACEIPLQLHISPTDRVVVIGDGKLGLLCAQVLALTGCDLTVLGHHQDKLAMLADLNIAATTDQTAVAPGVDIVIEATGNPGGYATALRLVRPRGTIVLKSTYAGNLSVDFSKLVVNEITLIGSRCGPFPPALQLLERGLIQVRPFIQARYSLHEAVQAFAHASRPGILKVLVDI